MSNFVAFLSFDASLSFYEQGYFNCRPYEGHDTNDGANCDAADVVAACPTLEMVYKIWCGPWLLGNTICVLEGRAGAITLCDGRNLDNAALKVGSDSEVDEAGHRLGVDTHGGDVNGNVGLNAEVL